MKSNAKPGMDSMKDTESAFLRTEVVFRTLFDMHSDAILIVRAAGGIVLEANRKCCDMLGYQEAEMTGLHVASFMPEVPELLFAGGDMAGPYDELLFMQETTWKHRDKHEIPVQVSMKKISLPGEPVLMVTARDISDLKDKEMALRASDERYLDLVENSGEGLGTVDPHENFTFVNPAACEIFGLPPHKLVGSNLLSFLEPHSIEEIKAQTSIRKAGQKSMYEIEIIRPDGDRRWIIVTATPQYDPDRNFTGTFGIFRDITNRKLAETKVRESEQRLHEIVDLTNDWIWEITPGWKYSFVSQKVYEILGYRPEEMIGRSPFDFLLPEDVAKVQEGVRSVVHQYKPLNSIVNRAKHKDGHLVYLETSGIPVFSEQGEYKGYRGADRDITLRKLYERELIVAKEKAEESDRLKSSILSNMSHELRTPLNGILGFAEILKDELHHSEYESMVDNIFSSGKRLMSTLNSIIMLSQLEAGKINIARKEFNIESGIWTVVKSLEFMSSEKKIYLDTSGIRSFLINTDEHLFTQLVHQILDNAIKFTDHGGITIETSEVSESGRAWMVVKISDTGIGIERPFYELIFQEFRQVSEGFGRKYQGSGIGLTISKKIIDLLGGRISVESEAGRGSCFSIWMPLDQETSVPAETRPPAEVTRLSEKPNAAPGILPVILLVEDNLVNKELTILLLRNTCQVEYAQDAATAIKMTGEKQYRAILMDINLGYGMNGIEATREIRKIPGYERTPIIAVTGYTMAEDKEQLFAAGCTHHIAKPFDKQTVIKLVQEILRMD
ncbi:MAG: PAS domain S-box protein [Bacteroidetes bacterium]|nr:PAS domain S-box protein [Bacteroidota bacterium]